MSWKYFTREEFQCRCGCGGNEIQDSFIDKMDELRDRVGFALAVNSGYRCPEHNKNVSSTGLTGPHTTGRASDLKVNRKRAYKLMAEASVMGFTGIGFKQHGGSRFIHLDDLDDAPGQPRPVIWSYR